MHAPKEPGRPAGTTKAPRRRRSRYREPSAEEVAVLQLIAEQVAIPLDQLARFLGCSAANAVSMVHGLEEAGCVKHSCLLAGDASWVWLNGRGARLSGTGFGSYAPGVRRLIHRRAVNEVRLHLAECAPEGRWICERTVRAQLEPGAHLPDGVLCVGGERHAIEVELTKKSPLNLRRIVAEHSARYDAVVYFCSPPAHRALARLRDELEDPKLFVRGLPGDPRGLALAGWRREGDPMPIGRPQRRAPEPWELPILRLLSEQGAIPLDRLARFLACELPEAERIAECLDEGTFVSRAYLLADEPAWACLTRRGARLSRTGLEPPVLGPGALAMLRATNEVRIHISRQAPQVRWVSRRVLLHELGRSAAVPRAVVEVGGERHAIEIELDKKTKGSLLAKYSPRLADYDAVACFCAPIILGKLKRLRAERHLSKLIVRPLPQSRRSCSSHRGTGCEKDPLLMPAIAPQQVAAEALAVIQEAAGLPEAPRMVSAERAGGSSAHWRVVTDAGTWRVSDTGHGWTVHKEPLGSRASRAPPL